MLVIPTNCVDKCQLTFAANKCAMQVVQEDDGSATNGIRRCTDASDPLHCHCCLIAQGLRSSSTNTNSVSRPGTNELGACISPLLLASRHALTCVSLSVRLTWLLIPLAAISPLRTLLLAQEGHPMSCAPVAQIGQRQIGEPQTLVARRWTEWTHKSALSSSRVIVCRCCA